MLSGGKTAPGRRRRRDPSTEWRQEEIQQMRVEDQEDRERGCDICAWGARVWLQLRDGPIYRTEQMVFWLDHIRYGPSECSWSLGRRKTWAQNSNSPLLFLTASPTRVRKCWSPFLMCYMCSMMCPQCIYVLVKPDLHNLK